MSPRYAIIGHRTAPQGFLDVLGLVCDPHDVGLHQVDLSLGVAKVETDQIEADIARTEAKINVIEEALSRGQAPLRIWRYKKAPPVGT